MKHFVYTITHTIQKRAGYRRFSMSIYQVKKNMLVLLGDFTYTGMSSKQACIHWLSKHPQKCEVPNKIMAAEHAQGGYDGELINKYATFQEI